MNNIKEEKYLNIYMIKAFIYSFVIGCFTHMFGLINVLHNYDNIEVQLQGYGTGIESGRWLLSILGDTFIKLGFGNNLPWICGILFIVLISISLAFIVDIFEITEKKYIFLTAACFTTFPTITSTLFFRYTAIYYGIAILLAVISAWIVIKTENKCTGVMISSLCMAFSLGIYQAYLPLVTSIFVLYLIKYLLKKSCDYSYFFKLCFRFFISIVLGLVLYFLFLKFFLKVYNVELGSYQGIDSIGKVDSNILQLVFKSFCQFITMPICNLYNLSPTKLISFSYIVIGIISISLMIFHTIQQKLKGLSVIILIGLLLIFPISVNLIVIMVPNGWIYTLMVLSFFVILLVPIVLFFEINASYKFIMHLKKINIGFLSVIIICNMYFANVNYTKMYYSNRQVENYFATLVAQIRMTEGFNMDKKWAFVGTLNDYLLYDSMNTGKEFGGNASGKDLTSSYSWRSWLKAYIGYSIPYAYEDEIEVIKQTEEYDEMEYWPNEGSIKVIGDYVVIKFSD